MSRSVALSTLRSRVRRAGSWENATGRVTDAEVDDAINEGIAFTWEAIVASQGHWKRSESTPANTSSGQQSYALGSTVLNLLAVKVTVSGRESSLLPINEVEAPEAGSLYTGTGTPQFYSLAGDYLMFWPTPDSAYSFRYSFVPTATVLVNGSDTFDGISGWERMAVYYAVREIAFKQKEWELSDRAGGIVSAEEQRIRSSGKRRDPLPATMVDTRGLERRNRKWTWK